MGRALATRAGDRNCGVKNKKLIKTKAVLELEPIPEGDQSDEADAEYESIEEAVCQLCYDLFDFKLQCVC